MSSFREFADGLFRPKTKGPINWGTPMYTLEQAFPPTVFRSDSKSATTQPVVKNMEVNHVDPPPGLSSSANQPSSSTSRIAPEPRASTHQYTGILDELRRQLQGDANGAPAATQVTNIPTGTGNIDVESARGGQSDGGGDNIHITAEETNDANKSEEIRQLIAELSRARKSEERMRRERNDWKSWAETFESELEESRKGKEEPPDDGKRDDASKGAGEPSYGGGDGGDNDGGGGDGGDPGDGDDATNPGGWRPGGTDPGSGDPPGDGTDTVDITCSFQHRNHRTRKFDINAVVPHSSRVIQLLNVREWFIRFLKPTNPIFLMRIRTCRQDIGCSGSFPGIKI